MKTCVQLIIIGLLLFFFGVVVFQQLDFLDTPWMKRFREARKHVAITEIQKTVRQAEKLSQEGNYVNAFRLVFDAAKTAKRIDFFLQVLGEEELPSLAEDAIMTLKQQLIHEDHSPLMKRFRDPDVLLEKKLADIEELRSLAVRKVKRGEDVRFQGNYQGTLVQLISSPRLRPREKLGVLAELQYVVQTDYVSKAQWDRINADIEQLRMEANRKFHKQHYVEAFILMDEAMQQARDVKFSGIDSRSLFQQPGQMRKGFVHADESPLMQVFKDRNIPLKTRQALWYVLRELVLKRSLSETGAIILRGHVYNGTLVQILRHPKVHWMTKESLVETIEGETFKHEPGYLSDLEWAHDEEFLSLVEQYRNELKAN